jgi:hypothetical protein
MEDMMNKIQRLVFVGAAAGCIVSPVSSYAESGTYATVVSLLTNYAKSERGSETVIGGASSGTSTTVQSSGGPFIEGSSALFECIVFVKKSSAGMDLEAPCMSTDASGDKVFLVAKRRSGDVNPGGGGEGKSEIVGGTGKYAGVSGGCTYKADYLSGNRVVTISQCKWQR